MEAEKVGKCGDGTRGPGASGAMKAFLEAEAGAAEAAVKAAEAAAKAAAEAADRALADGLDAAYDRSPGLLAREALDDMRYRAPADGHGRLCDATRAEVPPFGKIGRESFHGAWSLRELELSDGTERVGPGAFAWLQSLRYARVPASVREIGRRAFYRCDSLEAVRFEGRTKAEVKAMAGYPWGVRAPARTFVFGAEEPGEGDVELVTEADGRRRNPCMGAEAAEPPTPEEAGASNRRLAEVLRGRTDMRGGLMPLQDGDGVRTAYYKVTEADIPPSVGVIRLKAFSAYWYLEKVVFREGLKTVGEQAFKQCAFLREADLPDGLERIGPGAFRQCDGLEYVRVPASVREIGRDAFYGCRNATVFFEGRARAEVEAMAGYPWCLAPGQLAFDGDGDDIELVTEAAGRRMNPYAAFDYGPPTPEEAEASNARLAEVLRGRTDMRSGLMPSCLDGGVRTAYYKVTEADIPATVEEVGADAFNGYWYLEKVVFREGLKRIRFRAFYRCYFLHEADLPDGLE